MLQSLKSLTGSRLRAGDREGILTDAFFRIEDGKLLHFALDIGGWLDIDNVILSTALVRPPEESTETAWLFDIDDASLAQAPRWERQARDGTLGLLDWPPLIVGPTGRTVSPVLVYEAMQDMQSADDPQSRESTATPLVRHLERAGKWIGLPAFADQGELGRIRDILFDVEGMTIRTLELESPGLFPGKGAELPYRALRHMADQETHLVFDLPAEPAGAVD